VLLRNRIGAALLLASSRRRSISSASGFQLVAENIVRALARRAAK